MRTPTKEIVKKIGRLLRDERPDYIYLRDLFKKIREELNITVATQAKRLPYVPTESTLKKYYDRVWSIQNTQHMVIIKTLIYTGVRVQELVNIKIDDVDFNRYQVRINEGKGGKDRVVPFPQSFRETLMFYIKAEKTKGARYLFESNRKKPFTTRGIRKILAGYAYDVGMEESLSPHKLRHFLLTWLKSQGIDDALIQPYSGHASRKSLEVYSKLSLNAAQTAYDGVMDKFPI